MQPSEILSQQILAVAVYAGLNGLILSWFILHIIRHRWRAGVSLGDGGDEILFKGMRGQANFVEMVPFTIVLLFLAALMQAPLWLIHAFGISLTAGRVLHAWHFSGLARAGWTRTAGATLSILVLLILALGVTLHAGARLL